MKKHIEKLQFITHDLPNLSHIDQTQLACEAGAKWIQYRCLTKNDSELLEDIHLIATICDDWGATLIVTDHVHLKGQADIQGFHIEDMNADFIGLRAQLGDDLTLGGSATSVDGLMRLWREGVDYAGFGPFQTTTTKPNKHALLGLGGYSAMVANMTSAGIDLPVLAVGGVTLNDVPALLNTGIFGIAVSAAINQATDPREAYSDFYKLIY